MAIASKQNQSNTSPKDDIIALPDPRLRQKSKRIGHVDDSTEQLARHMIASTLDWEESREHEFGAALAAVQLGQLYRVVVVRNDFEDKDEKSFGVFINPEIVKVEGEPEEAMEGCLSVPDLYGMVPRYPKVKVKALNLMGQPVRVTATGFLARVFQHEIDHTEGTLFVDRVKDANKLFKLEKDGKFTKFKGGNTGSQDNSANQGKAPTGESSKASSEPKGSTSI
jgi:peptide deformylase